MSCITQCLGGFSCLKCCFKKKETRRKYSASEAKVHNVSQISITPTVLPLAPVLQKKMIARSPKREPSVELNRQPHNRFVSTEVVNIRAMLKE